MKKNILTLVVLFIGITSIMAQDKVPNLQDLIGAKGSSAESAMENRGYTHVNTNKSGSDAYSNWWHETGKKCITVHVTNGRVKSAVFTMPADCKRNHTSGSHTSTGNVPNLQDLIGAKGSSAESAMENRGYRHINTSKSGSDAYSNWWHETGKKCVTVRVSNGRVKSAVFTMPADCKRNHTSGSHTSTGNVPNLQDLIGAKGSSAESAMENRGYRHINTNKSGSDIYSNWWHETGKKCVAVRISNGRVKSAVFTMPADCNKR